MADEPQYKILKVQGVVAWNQWRARNKDVRPFLRDVDLSRTDLSEADLNGADLSWADLRESGLSEADLSGAYLTRANLSWAYLTRANLSGADLGGANLSGADLNGADLSGANLSGANLSGADLTKAHVGWTTFADSDLKTAKGLETVVHVGPSSIGIDTLFKSHGNIPLAFLRGAGVPDAFITYIGSLVGRPIEFYSCFISYSSQDQNFAERLHADLQSRGVRCWFAPEDLKIGGRFQERIEESIRFYGKVMIVLSEASVQSRWVEREVNAAREREDRANRTVLFPIRIDDSVMNAPQPWAADIRRSRQIADFSRWKDHDSYVRALDRLLRDLKASEKKE